MHIAGTGERCPFNHSKTAQTDNNTVQRNAHRLGEIWKHVCYTSPKLIDQRRREIRLSVENGQSIRTSKDNKRKAWWNWLKDSLGMTEIRVWPEQTCCECAHVEKRVNLPVVTGSNYLKIQEFYESVNRNNDALLSMGEADMLRGFVMSTLNKLPQEARYCANQRNWENWDMEASINNFQQWLKRHKVDDVPGNSGGVWPKREKHWFSGERKDPVCIFCKGKHWVDAWEVIKTMEARRHFFQEKELCFNCGRTGPWGKFCRSCGFYNCKSKHHTGLSNRARGNETETPLSSNAVLNGYTPSFEEKSLPANSPFETQRDHILGVSRHRIREELNLKAINRLGLKPPRHESRQIVTVNGTKKQSLSVFSEKIKWVRK